MDRALVLSIRLVMTAALGINRHPKVVAHAAEGVRSQVSEKVH
jgi:hypothetical protein